MSNQTRATGKERKLYRASILLFIIFAAVQLLPVLVGLLFGWDDQLARSIAKEAAERVSFLAAVFAYSLLLAAYQARRGVHGEPADSKQG